METPVNHWEYTELKELIESKTDALRAEDKRLNERLKVVEDTTRQISDINLTLQKQSDNLSEMSANITRILKRQDESNERIKAIEDKDGERWRRTVKSAGQIIVGLIGGLLLAYARNLLKI